jgi:DNA-binding transcriptional ArsR family regulator
MPTETNYWISRRRPRPAWAGKDPSPDQADAVCSGVVDSPTLGWGEEKSSTVEASMDPRVERFPTRGWTFITHHAHVLLAVAADPDLRVKEIAEVADITERYAYRVLSDLEEAGFVHRVRRGRCNRYRVNAELALGDPVVEEQSIRGLLRLSRRGAPPHLRAAPARRKRSAGADSARAEADRRSS